MTAFTLPCWKKWHERSKLRLTSKCIKAFGVYVLLLLMAYASLSPCQAAERELVFRQHELVAVDTFYVINAALTLNNQQHLQEMVESGLSLPFQLEFVLTRARWYWLDEKLAERSINYRLSYHALTRQFRLSIGSIHRNFSNFEDALHAMLTLRNWTVMDGNRLHDNETYDAALRMRLDVSQLPKPFQVSALGSRDLNLSTGWIRWDFAVPSTEAK